MRIGHRRPPVLCIDEPVDVLHWPRAIQRDHGGNVADVRRFELFDVALHPGAFQLEHVGGVSGGEQFVCRPVVQRQGLQINLDAPALPHQLDRLVKDGEAGEAEKVHFEQPQVGHRVHAELGHQHRAGLVAPHRPLQRHRLGQRLIGDEHTGGVGADVVDDSLQALRLVHQVANRLVAVVGTLELGADAQGVLQVPCLERHHAGYAVHIAVAHAQGPANVSQGGLGAQRPVGDDLGHTVIAVLVDDVVQYLVAPVVLEVHVDVRHFLAFHVQEALEDETVLQRINVGDAKGVQHDAGGGTAPHAEHYVALAHEIDDVPHDQEIVGEAGIADNLQLIAQPLHRSAFFTPGGSVRVAAPESLLADLGQVFVGVHAAGGLVARQVGLPELQRNVAHIGDYAGIGQRLGGNVPGQADEQRLHLLRTLDIVGVVLHPQPLFVPDRSVGLDADVDVLQVGLVLMHVVGVVGGHQRQPIFKPGVLRQPQQPLVDLVQLRYVLVALQLQEISFTEQLAVPASGLDRAVVVPIGQQPGHLGGGTARQADQARAVFLQQALVDARAVVEALDVGLGDQLHQVAVAGVVAGQQHQVRRAPLRGVLLVPAVMGDVDLATYDGLDASVEAGGVKVHHTIEGAVVGDGQRIHAQLARAFDQLGDAADAVEHAVFGVDVQVGKRQGEGPPRKMQPRRLWRKRDCLPAAGPGPTGRS